MRYGFVCAIALWCIVPHAYSDHKDANILLGFGIADAEVFHKEVRTHLGAYGTLSLGYLFHRSESSLALIPAIGIEWSPDGRKWGLSGSVTGEYHVSKHVAIDVTLAVVHDQEGTRWSNAEFFIGGGPGVSFYVGRRFIFGLNMFIMRCLGPEGGFVLMPSFSTTVRF